MDPGRFRFERFTLDTVDRRLSSGGAPVELNARYLDALALLVREPGRLVTKERFHDEVWRGVPVTDEALTQCIRTLRRQLGDDAARPRFIETVPKHGYRFIAAVEALGDGEPSPPFPSGPALAAGATPGEAPSFSWRDFLLLGGAGTIGGGMAGMIGGLFYGFAGAAQPLAPGMGAASVLLVLLTLTIAVAVVGGGGVGFGIAAAGFAQRGGSAWTIAGGAAGGLVVGAVAKLLGVDAFQLLLGRSPGDITGAAEGALLGAAVGLGAWLGARREGRLPLRRSVAAAAAAGGAAGILIPLLGGRLMGGSLDELARHLPGSRLRLDQIGVLFGEDGFGPVSEVATGLLEGALFGGCVVGAMILARRSMNAQP
jgi:DNA-binding winged helix-turn-helix (wHTH) protein